MDANRQADAEWNAGAMGCGELLIELRARLRKLTAGQLFRLIADDPGAVEDIPSWCSLTGHHLVKAQHPEYLIQRKDD